MAYCASCGAALDGKFCQKCGAPAEVGAEGGAASAGATESSATPHAASGAGLSSNVASALCYSLGLITGVIFLAIEPYNRDRTIRFHAMQSILMTLAWMAIGVVLFTMLSIISTMYVAIFLNGALRLAGFLLWLYMMWTCYNGQKIVLPVIGPIAEKQVG